MAKTKRSSGGRRDAAHGPFDAKRFRSPRIQATFDYDELSLMRAANQLGQVGRNVVLAVAFVSLGSSCALSEGPPSTSRAWETAGASPSRTTASTWRRPEASTSAIPSPT